MDLCHVSKPLHCSGLYVVLFTLVSALSASAVTVTRGPFLQLQTPSSMSIVWMTDVACTGEVEWGLTAGYGSVQASAAVETRHEIAITGLAADTLYHYRVRYAGTPLTADATFRTAPAADATSLSFSFVGDSCSSPSNCTATYNAMLSQSNNGFCITLGDLAGRGEDNITDYWQSHFFTPAANFIKNVCMYPNIGNHELYNENAVYVYPGRYEYNWSIPTAGSGTELYYSFDKAHVHFTSVDTYWTPYSTGTAQYNWLAGDLAAATKPWKIVFGHEGPYISEDGTASGRAAMRTSITPLFEQYGVDLYLHGNYHYYQRNTVNGVHYIDQGTGGQPWGAKHADDSQPYVQAYADQIYCYTRLDIQGNRLLGRCFKTSDGAVLDGYQIDKPPITLPWQDAFPSSGAQLNWIAPWNYTTQCGVIARAGNPSGDGYCFQVGDTSSNQYAYPMLANGSLTDISMEAQVYYDASTSVKNRYGIGLRGRQFFDSSQCSFYALVFVRNDALGSNGHALLIQRNAGVETVLADWAYPDTSGWHKVKLIAYGSELTVWIDNVLKTPAPIVQSTLAKGRPFIYNYRATSGAKTLVDDVAISDLNKPTVFADFEEYANETAVMFRLPRFSGSTSAHLTATPDLCRVITAQAYSGSKLCRAEWAFVDTTPQRWLRLTTSNTANLPNPTVDLTRPIRLRVRLNNAGSLRVCLGIRETGIDVPIGADGGKTGTIEWLGATSVVNGAPQGTLITVPAGQWQILTFNPLSDPAAAFTGDGVLSAANNKGVLEHVAFAAADSEGPFSVDLDLFEQPQSDSIQAPTITSHPASVQACPGTTTTFTIAAGGGGTLSYQWQKNGVNLFDDGHYSGSATAGLTITGTDSADVAGYCCMVTNGGGSVVSNQAALTVRTGTSITQQPSSQSACPGATVQLTATGAGDGAVAYQWRKNGNNLNNGGHYAGVTTSTLTVSNMDRNDAASYQCIVTAGCGSVTSNDVSLVLKNVTSIVQQPANQSVAGGGNAQFTVAAAGSGVLSYQWQRNGVNLADGGNIAGAGTATLAVSGVGRADYGLYRCLVAADCGIATSNTAVLTVHADTNGDLHVDSVDFDMFSGCYNGPTNLVAGDCLQLDYNGDHYVDSIDFDTFSACYNGPTNLPGC